MRKSTVFEEAVIGMLAGLMVTLGLVALYLVCGVF